MNSGRLGGPDRAKEVFLEVRELPRELQAQRLQQHSNGEVRSRVEALLAADHRLGQFLAWPTREGEIVRHLEGEFVLLQRALAGRFSLDREIGRGGMGVVYLAHDVALNRAVAVKVLPSAMHQHVEYRERFLREVRMAAGLTHPNIVPIHLVDEHEEVICFVMSFIDGETLRARVERNGPLPSSEAMRVMQDVAWALAHAHEHGIVHRDVKPDNILMDRATGRALVTDFGIATTIERGGVLSTDGVFLGTPLFTSPEQAAGHAIDHRSDLYSLGATMFLALTGRPVFDASTAAIALDRHISEPPPRIGTFRPDLPRALADAVDMCLTKDPADRFQSAEELAKALTAVTLSEPDVAEPIRRVTRETTQLTADLMGWGLFASFAAAGWLLAKLTSGGFLMDLLTPMALLFLWTGVAIFSVRSAEAIGEFREAIRKGFTVTQIRDALVLESSSGRRKGTPRPWQPISLLIFAAITTAACWVYFWGPFGILGLPGGRWLKVPQETVAIFGPYLLGRLAFRQAMHGRPRFLSWLRSVNALVGRIVMRAATWKVKVAADIPVPRGSTESILLGSAHDVLAQLPAVFRDHLTGVPDLMRRLHHHADVLRARRSEIEKILAEAGSSRLGDATSPDRVANVLRVRMESSRAALDASYRSISSQLTDVIAALESVRLGLLRLRAGVATPSDLTADLELARQVGDAVDAMLSGWREANNVIGATHG
jgi:tRNA A-37 threonylcarbamoyl transferase component Bud32